MDGSRSCRESFFAGVREPNQKGLRKRALLQHVFLSESTLLDNAGQDSVMNISFLLDVVIFHLPLLCNIREVWHAWGCRNDVELYHVNIALQLLYHIWILHRTLQKCITWNYMTVVFRTTHGITIVSGLISGKVYIWFFLWNIGGSCEFSFEPIHWNCWFKEDSAAGTWRSWSPTQVILMNARAKRNGPGVVRLSDVIGVGEAYMRVYIYTYVYIHL